MTYEMRIKTEIIELVKVDHEEDLGIIIIDSNLRFQELIT